MSIFLSILFWGLITFLGLCGLVIAAVCFFAVFGLILAGRWED
jgi:hypothetical protein